ncbi:MAG: class I SAM-dependent methyltransferase, partial [Paludibacteraceae bacterium]|nr:class I SAM-dependent methyltransferase [Paludibacteraceae bacterium]
TDMALSNIEKHYNKHPEDLRLLRRHGIVEFETTMYQLRKYLSQGQFLLDIGAGTGRYTSALMAEGYKVKAVELVRRNIDVFLKREPTADVVQGDARNMPFFADGIADVTLMLGPLYHLINEEEKLKALNEAKRVTKPGGIIFVAYLMNEYSILSYCFDEDRIGELLAKGQVDSNFHIRAQEGELYDYLRIEDIDRLNEKAGLERVTIFSPDGAADYMRTRLNRMSDETFAHFIEYQKCICERPDLIGAGSHVVDVVRRP